MRRNILNSLPFVEKYRPRDIDDLILDESISLRINAMIANKEIRNMILEGPPGVGKTSTIKCIAEKIYGDLYGEMVTMYNASDERGIIIQNHIENFRISINKSSTARKLVILDEADNMTNKAQHIISSFMERHSSEIMFALTCNSNINIIESIKDKCIIINYPKISCDNIYKRLKYVCRKENITPDPLTKKGIRALSELSDGDMRNAINMLQLTLNRFDNITPDNVFAMHDKPKPELSKEIFQACIDQNIARAIICTQEMKKMGFSSMDIMLGWLLALRLPICNDIDDLIKINFSKIICQTVYNISKGVDTKLQITACLAEMCDTTNI